MGIGMGLVMSPMSNRCDETRSTGTKGPGVGLRGAVDEPHGRRNVLASPWMGSARDGHRPLEEFDQASPAASGPPTRASIANSLGGGTARRAAHQIGARRSPTVHDAFVTGPGAPG